MTIQRDRTPHRQKAISYQCFLMKSSLLRFCVGLLLLWITCVAKAGPGADVVLSKNGDEVVLSNGILAATISKKAMITSLKFRGFEMASNIYYSMSGGPNFRVPSGGRYFVKVQTGDLVDIGFKRERRNEPQAFDCEVHYVLKRGASGLYTYAILEHPKDYPATKVGEWRMVWKLSNDLIEKVYVDELRHWEMPGSKDQTEQMSIKEVRKVLTGARAGHYDSKYDFNVNYYDVGCWGHASDKNKVGGWIVLGGYDFFNDGPTKQDLSAASGINHIHFGMNHYNSSSTTVAAGEAWRKIYGPILLYCNFDERGGDACWEDARNQAKLERSAWPYAWLTETPEYPPVDARGAVTGRLVVRDVLKPALAGSGAWVGVAQPAPGGNWQFESNHYQYWVKAGDDGRFSIPNIRPGTYTFYAFTDGAVGEYSRSEVNVTAGNATALGEVVWEVPHKGSRIAWEIGVPDRTAKEFRHGKDYFHGYVWAHFHEEFANPLEYVVGKSDRARDWNYAHSWYQMGDKIVPHKWRINFNLAQAPGGNATMTFAFAGAHLDASVAVYVNDEAKALGRVKPSIQGGNAMLREAIHGKYCVEYFSIPASSLKQGANTITLEQTRMNIQAHVMYDYLNLELP